MKFNCSLVHSLDAFSAILQTAMLMLVRVFERWAATRLLILPMKQTGRRWATVKAALTGIHSYIQICCPEAHRINQR